MGTRIENLVWLLLCGLALGCDRGGPPADKDASVDASKAPDAAANGRDAGDAAPSSPNAATPDAAIRDAAIGTDATPASYDAAGPCVPGAARCHGKMGYQECQADGGWSESRSCAGYSPNGTASYCAVVTPAGGEPWAACVEPACWYWISSGVVGEMSGETPAGVCVTPTALAACRPDGTLAAAQECSGVCRTTGTLNGSSLGFCAAECSDGARECLAGPLYRQCTNGRWETEPHACANAALCEPATSGAVPSIVCGGPCQAGTSRCAVAGNLVETCSDGEWRPGPPCTVGRCTQTGPQAECEAECAPAEHACAYDGAVVERVCGADGLWQNETPCASGEQCRVSGSETLGCVECVGSERVNGNAYGLADSACQNDAVIACTAQDRWGAAAPCASGACVERRQGSSSVAYCSAQ